jgi:hypothetical protein
MKLTFRSFLSCVLICATFNTIIGSINAGYLGELFEAISNGKKSEQSNIFETLHNIDYTMRKNATPQMVAELYQKSIAQFLHKKLATLYQHTILLQYAPYSAKLTIY